MYLVTFAVMCFCSALIALTRTIFFTDGESSQLIIDADHLATYMVPHARIYVTMLLEDLAFMMFVSGHLLALDAARTLAIKS